MLNMTSILAFELKAYLMKTITSSKTKAKPMCTQCLILVSCFSPYFAFIPNPRKSMQNEVVRVANTESALLNVAAVKPIINAKAVKVPK